MRYSLQAVIVMLVVVVGVADGLSLAETRRAQQEAADLFQQALVKERADGQLEEAIEIYRRALAASGDDRNLAAQALVRIGACYEKLGDQQAREAYQQVLSEYADQAAPAAEARTRLAALPEATATASDPQARSVPARLAWDDTPFPYLENSSVSPDGTRIAYRAGRGTTLELGDLDSGDITTLLGPDPDDPYSLLRRYLDFTWSPDGRTIAFREVDRRAPEEFGTLKLIDTVTREVTVPEPAPRDFKVLDWSNDGRYLLGNILRRDTTATLVRVAIGSWEVVPLVSKEWQPGGGRAAFSPADKHVVFELVEDGTPRVDLMAVDGSARHRLSPDGGSAPFWSPDGRTIIYYFEEGWWAVSVADGVPQGQPRPLPNDDMWVHQWTDDGSLFVIREDSRSGVFRAGIDPVTGAGTGEVEDMPGVVENVGFLAWSPDMTQLAFTAGFRPTMHVYSTIAGTTKSFPLEGVAALLDTRWDAAGEHVLTTPYGPPRRDGIIFAVNVDSGAVRPWPARSSSAGALYAAGERTMTLRYDPYPERIVVVSNPGEPEGRVLAEVGPDDAPFDDVFSPTFSPDGKRVLIGRQKDVFNTRTTVLWVVSPDGSGLRKLAETDQRIRRAPWADLGRFEVTAEHADLGRFKMPTLRNVELTGPYIHDGSIATLEDVVDFYANGANSNPNLDPVIRPLRLDVADRAALLAFLRSLTSPAIRF